jgi:hypothetical protein
MADRFTGIAAVAGGGTSWRFRPAADFGAGEKLTATRFAQNELAGAAAMPSAVEILYSLTRS